MSHSPWSRRLCSVLALAVAVAACSGGADGAGPGTGRGPADASGPAPTGATSTAPTTGAGPAGGVPSTSAAPTTGRPGTTAPGGGGDLTLEDCIEEMVEALAAMDMEGIDATDGLDADEEASLSSQFAEVERRHPNLAGGGPCDGLGEPTEEQFDVLLREVDPMLLLALGLGGTSKLEPVGDTIE